MLIDEGLRQCGIVDIDVRDDDADRYAAPVEEQRVLDPGLTVDDRFGPCARADRGSPG